MSNKQQKKLLVKLIALVLTALALFSLFGCSKAEDDDGKIQILCTLFSQYDWIRNIVGDSENIELKLIIANGADPHSYQPTAADILAISNCDMIVFVGGDSDNWVKEALERTDDPSIKQIALMELDGVTLHDISSSSGEHGHEHEDHKHSTFDEHIWLSLKNAQVLTMALGEIIASADPENAELYIKNAIEYVQKLENMSTSFESALSSVLKDERFVIFADRFPFVYLLSDYEIGYQAAFEGCTTDVDASFDTVLELIHEANLHSAEYIMVTESSDGALARTVANSAKADSIEVLTLDSMQSISQSRISNGETYLSIMEKNLMVLKKALCK